MHPAKTFELGLQMVEQQNVMMNILDPAEVQRLMDVFGSVVCTVNARFVSKAAAAPVQKLQAQIGPMAGVSTGSGGTQDPGLPTAL